MRKRERLFKKKFKREELQRYRAACRAGYRRRRLSWVVRNDDGSYSACNVIKSSHPEAYSDLHSRATSWPPWIKRGTI